MTKKFNRKRSLDEGEIVLEEVSLDEAISTDVEVIVPIEQESANVEVTVSASDTTEPTQAEIKFAKGFTGTPTPVSDYALELAQSCARKKLLAEFESGQYARGSQWHVYCKR